MNVDYVSVPVVLLTMSANAIRTAIDAAERKPDDRIRRAAMFDALRAVANELENVAQPKKPG